MSASVWPVLHYDDTRNARDVLTATLGFDEVIARTDDAGDVVHAELRWPGGGTILFGGTKHTDSVHGAMAAGSTAAYLVVATAAEVDAIHARVAADARCTVLQPPAQTTFGSGDAAYACSVADHEGNLWTVGDYRGR